MTPHSTQVQQAIEFDHRVISPILATILDDGRAEKFPMTLRQVRDEHGRDAVRVFKLMFKQLVRGGRDRNGNAYKSQWVVNRPALHPFVIWTQVSDGTLKQLHELLLKAKVTEEVWVSANKTWVTRAMKKAAKATASRKQLRTAEERAQAEALQ